MEWMFGEGLVSEVCSTYLRLAVVSSRARTTQQRRRVVAALASAPPLQARQ